MTPETEGSAPHYWYEKPADQGDGVSVLEAMRAYREAESAMRRRTQETMGLGENDVLAMRYLIRAQDASQTVGPKELSEYLGISSASVTALLDRLEKGGYIRRQPSPFDRRALVIVPVVAADGAVHELLGEMPETLIDIARRLDPGDAETITEFLGELRDAVDQIDRHDAAVSSTPDRVAKRARDTIDG